MSQLKTKLTLKEILGSPISREEALRLVKSDHDTYNKFLKFDPEYQEQVLAFIQGSRGLPILYDTFFKAIMHPVNTPERLERFLSCLLGQSVTITEILPLEGSQMTADSSFVIMDIRVQLEDGSYITVEMQKHGYEFTGERSCCYMSDMVMRQYNLAKAKSTKKNFSYKDIKPVYLIVLMENSAAALKKATPHYIHRSQYSFDTGAELNLLTNYIYISLDTFHSVVQNISSYLEAWLAFLSSDEPGNIIQLVESYPEFREYYHDITMFRRKPKELMNMFSEALLQMDRNTANYMIEELAKEYEIKLAQKDTVIAEKDAVISEKDAYISEKDAAISEKDAYISEKDAYIKELEARLAKQNQP